MYFIWNRSEGRWEGTESKVKAWTTESSLKKYLKSFLDPYARETYAYVEDELLVYNSKHIMPNANDREGRPGDDVPYTVVNVSGKGTIKLRK